MVWLHVGVMLNLTRILFLEAIYVRCMYGIGRGVCRISQGGGGPTLKFLGFWIYMPRRKQRSCEPLLGGFGGIIFKNGAISCVLGAIFNQFHGKKILLKNYK